MSIDSSQVDTLLGIALIIGTPFFILFGWLSDKMGKIHHDGRNAIGNIAIPTHLQTDVRDHERQE
jgi:hypothetical protein